MKHVYPLVLLFQFISIALFGNGELVHYCEKAPLIDHLNSINKEWDKQKDLPTDLLTIPMKFNTDEERIQLHLQLVESILNQRSNDHLTIQQFANRKKNLTSLVEYWSEGQFPINTRHSHRQPYFIDDFGTACAVGHLLLTSGEEQLAHHISNIQNYAYIHEMNYPELDEWAVENGFTADELAWIQPGYGEFVCYSVDEVENPGQTYSNENIPLSQQEIKVITHISGKGMIYGGNFLHTNLEDGTQTASVFGEINGNYVSYGNSIQGTVYDIEHYNQRIYVAGDFVLAGTNFYNIAYWDGTDWVGIQTGDMGGIIRDMVVYNCDLYIGGDFSTTDGNSIANLARWDGMTWSAIPYDCYLNMSATQALQVNGPVNALEVYQGSLAIGGDFTQVIGNPNVAEGLVFLTSVIIQFPPTHGSLSSVNALQTYSTTLMVGEDSLYGYQSSGQWFFPGDVVSDPFLELPEYSTSWIVPPITNVNEIYYAFSNIPFTPFGFNHLMVSTDDGVWAINSSTVDGAFTPGLYSDYLIETDGTVSAMWGNGFTAIYGGNFNTVDIAEIGNWFGSCQDNHFADKLFSLQRWPSLPIELAKFTVKSDDNKTAQLAWTSLTENNSLHYEIERRTDNEDFTRVGTVAAAGESLEEINYTYEDDISKISDNYVYYRLKMVDKDGSYEYSEVRSLKLETRDSGISIAPNPAVNNVELSMKMQAGGDVNVHIYDMQGRQLCNYQWTYNAHSVVSERIDVSHLEAGLYLVEVISSHERKTMKLDVLR